MDEATDALIPMYGFLQGDTLGILVLAHESDSMAMLMHRLQQAATPRVTPYAPAQVIFQGNLCPSNATVKSIGMTPLSMFYVQQGSAS